MAAQNDFGTFCKIVGYEREPWQLAAFSLETKFTILVSPRQSGKSQSLSLLALWIAFRKPRQSILVVSAGEDASGRIVRMVRDIARHPLLSGSVEDETLSRVILSNGSKIRSVPASERQIRGEALSVSTPILTTDGWKTMGSIQVGDFAYGPDGKPTQVVLTSPVFLGRRCYEVEFTDGSTVIADEEHLWSVYDYKRSGREPHGSEVGRSYGNHLRWHVGRNENSSLCKWCTGTPYERLPHPVPGGPRTMTTGELLEGPPLYSQSSGYRYRVRCDSVIERPEVEVPIDPYVFGFWLGDGFSTRARLSVGDFPEDIEFLCGELERSDFDVMGVRVTKEKGGYIQFTTPSERRPTRHGDVRPPRNQFPALLRALGLFGDKFIPEQYLLASVEQRKALLAGLLDSNGHTSTSRRSPRAEFSNTNKHLAHDVLQLVRSLGQKATLTERPAEKEKWQTSYVVSWTPTFNPCRLPRKKAKWTQPFSDQQRWMSITAIREVPSVPTRCITVAHPEHTYLVGSQFTLTHNTSDLLLVDEAAFVSDEILLSAAIPTTAARPEAKIILSSTPWGDSGVFASMYRKGLAGDPHYRTFQWRRKDARWISEAVIEAMRETMSPMQFAAEYEGEFIALGDAYFPKEQILAAVCGFPLVETPPERLPGICGLDWGRRQDSHAIVIAGQLDDYGVNDRPIVIVPYVETSHRTYTAQIDRIVDITKMWSLDEVYSETNGVGQYPTEALSQRAGVRTHIVPVSTTLSSKEDVYGRLAVLLASNSLVLPSSPSLLRQMTDLIAEPTPSGGLRIHAKSESAHDDLPDALSLAVAGLPPELMPVEQREVDDGVTFMQTQGGDVEVPIPVRTHPAGYDWGRVWENQPAKYHEEPENPWLRVYGRTD